MWAARRCNLALKPDGGEVFVSNSLSITISEIYTRTDDVGGRVHDGRRSGDGAGFARQLAALRSESALAGCDGVLD